MNNNPKTLIIIPAYNESEQITDVIVDVKNLLPGVHVFVIDDGSSDDTAKIARRAGAIVATMPFNAGYGMALQTGYKYAKRHEYDYVVQMDGDGQHEPRSIPDLLKVLAETDADIALGSRYLGKGDYRTSWLRKFGQTYFGFIANLMTKYKVTDPTTGFQALSKDVVAFFCTEVYPVDYPDADVIIMLDRAGFNVVEVPVEMYVDESGNSMHSGWKPLYYGIKMMMSIMMTVLRDDRKIRRSLSHG